MTISDSGDKSLEAGAEVNEKWCVGDPVAYTKDSEDGIVGMADQAIYKAQDGGNKGDAILQPKVYVDTNNCALVEGRLAKIKK